MIARLLAAMFAVLGVSYVSSMVACAVAASETATAYAARASPSREAIALWGIEPRVKGTRPGSEAQAR